MRRVLVVAAVAALLAGPACSRGGDDDGFRLTIVDGEALVGDDVLDEGDHTVDEGATVSVVDGTATLALPGDREVLLRAGTELVVGRAPELLEGDAVVVAAEETTLAAGGIDLTVAAGAARVQRGVATTVAMYGGTADVTSAGRPLDGGLAALRQVTVSAAGQLPREPSPLVYDAEDAWDERFLGDAIDLGRDLDGLSRGFTAQLGPGAAVDAELLGDVLPLEVDDSLLADDRSPGETLVGAAIVVEADDDVDDTWAEVFGFRGDGAEWGLVALDQAVERDPLLGTLDGAFDRSPLLFAAGPVDGGPTVIVGTTPTTAAPPTGGTTTTTPGAAPQPTTPPAPDDDGEDEDEPDGPVTTVPPPTVPPVTIPPVFEDGDPDEPAPGDAVAGVVDLIGDLLDGDPPDEGAGGDVP